MAQGWTLGSISFGPAEIQRSAIVTVLTVPHTILRLLAGIPGCCLSHQSCRERSLSRAVVADLADGHLQLTDGFFQAIQSLVGTFTNLPAAW